MKTFLFAFLSVIAVGCGKADDNNSKEPQIADISPYDVPTAKSITYQQRGGMPVPEYSNDLDLELTPIGEKVRAHYKHRNCDLTAYLSRFQYDELAAEIAGSPTFIGFRHYGEDMPSKTLVVRPAEPDGNLAKSFHLNEVESSIGRPVLSRSAKISTLIDVLLEDFSRNCPSILYL